MRVLTACVMLLLGPTLFAAESIPTLAISAEVFTAGADGERWELTIRPNGTASLTIHYMLSPSGSMSGEFYLSPVTIERLRGVVAAQRFMELPSNIVPDHPMLHAPRLHLTVTLGDRTHKVLVSDPEELKTDARVRRFLAVWTDVFAALPLRPAW